jgi:hypothetical protein
MNRTRVLVLLVALGCGTQDRAIKDTNSAPLRSPPSLTESRPADSTRTPVADQVVSASAPATDSTRQPADVIRAYYRAINSRDFTRAYAFWSDSGRASGQSAGEFTRGFAQTASVSVSIGTVGRIEGAAGSRYTEIPVTVEARQTDGNVNRFRGAYTLRRTVVPGATAAQRAWHLYSAKLTRVN